MHFKVFTILGATILLLGHCFTAPGLAHASDLPEDSTAATVYTYFSINAARDDSDPLGTPQAASLSLDKFREQLDEITSGSYTVMDLTSLLQAQQSGRSLPRRTLALTFDHPDATFISVVAPLLAEKKVPFAVFISAGQIDQKQTSVSWDDIRQLKKTDGATIGMTAYNYGHLATWSKDKLAADMNQARSRIREELNLEPAFFAYPFGESSPAYRDVVEQQGFTAAFGQNSGVIYKDQDALSLPRFTITDEYSDIERLRMTADALPFPVTDIEPASMVLDGKLPFPGFTVPAAFSAADLKGLTCFASGAGQMTITLLGKNRVELRFPQELTDALSTWRGRINCTLPVKSADDVTDIRWRWLGFLYSIPD